MLTMELKEGAYSRLLNEGGETEKQGKKSYAAILSYKTGTAPHRSI